MPQKGFVKKKIKMFCNEKKESYCSRPEKIQEEEWPKQHCIWSDNRNGWGKMETRTD
jgi:hypothetical protein